MDALGPNQTFRTIDRKPVYWRDARDVVHSCEGSEVHRGITLIWTLCERDVPANAAYKCDGDDITCAACKCALAPSRKIVTKFDPPPIPVRECDWSAVFDDYDLGSPIGHGATEQDAIDDLMMEAEA